MEKKTKIIVGISLGIVAAVGTYFAVTKLFKKPEEELPEEKEQITPTLPTKASSSASTPAKQQSVVINKAAPKAPVFSAPKNRKQNWVYANMANTKAYKHVGGKISSLYNTYQVGNVIGTYVGQVSIGGHKYFYVNDKGNSIIVSSNAVYLKLF
jgi:hypothetical protein